MQHELIPMHLHFHELNPEIVLSKIPARIPLKSEPWRRGKKKRLATVSSFGFSGTNAHVVLEEPAAPIEETRGDERKGSHLLCVSARSDQALKDLAKSYVEYLIKNGAVNLGDVCFTAAMGRTHFSKRLGVVGKTVEEMGSKLEAFVKGEARSGLVQAEALEGVSPKVAFLFSGQGSQYPGMAKELYEREAVFKRTLDQCLGILEKYVKEPLLPIIFDESRKEELNQTQYTQPILFAIEYSLSALWRSWGVEAAAVMGHSVGEVVAACVAGMMSLEDGLRLIAKRGELMHGLAGKGAMASVSASEERVKRALEGSGISIAALNGPGNITISGEESELERVLKVFEGEGLRIKRLSVSQRAFHSRSDGRDARGV